MTAHTESNCGESENDILNKHVQDIVFFDSHGGMTPSFTQSG